MFFGGGVRKALHHLADRPCRRNWAHFDAKHLAIQTRIVEQCAKQTLEIAYGLRELVQFGLQLRGEVVALQARDEQAQRLGRLAQVVLTPADALDDFADVSERADQSP